MRTGHVLAGAALFLAALGLVAAGVAQGQLGTQDPPDWFSPVSGVGPGDHEDAWHLRTHLRVEGAVDQPVGTPVQIHLDLGREALAAGWPAEADGDAPRSFNLDPDSVQLVRYDHNWDPVEVVPAHVDTSWYERDQTARYDRSQEGAFHPRLNPVVTVEWRLTEEIHRSARNYLLQFDTVENHGVPPVEASAHQEERLDALYWVGPGIVLHGSHPGTNNDARPTLTILGTEDGTEVEVFTYDGPFSFPADYGRRGNPEQAPFTLDEGETVPWSFGTQPTLFRIEATEPVIALEHGLQAGGSGDFVPSTDGDLLGTHFRVPHGAGQVYLIAPPPSDENGGDDAIAFTTALSEQGTNCGGQVHPPGTSVHDYYCRLATQEEKIREIQAEEPVLVQYVPAGNARIQAPTVTGSPVGQTFLAATTQGGGVAVQGHEASATVRFEDPSQNDRRRGQEVTAGIQHATEQATSGWPSAPGASQGETVPHRIQAQDPDTPIVTWADGGGPQQTTSLGGSHGQRFQGAVPVSVQPFYDATDVEVTFPNAPDANLTSTLSNARALTVDPAGLDNVQAGDPVVVEATKPVSVVPINNGLRQYSRFLAAQPVFEEAQVLASEYRGYLVDVRPASGQSPVLVEASPGKKVEVPFLVQNLGRWDGEPLPDRIELEATSASDTWDVDTHFEDPAPSPSDNQARENTLFATLPNDIQAGERVSVRVEGTSANNENMTSAFDALLLSQTAFGVDMWIGPPDPTQRNASARDTEVQLEPGESASVELAVMNTGTTSDAYNLSVDGASGGWEATTLKDEAPVDQVGPLEPGEAEAFELEVKALDLVEIGMRSLVVRADSVGSSEIAEVGVEARLAGQQAIDLSASTETRTVEPGTTTTFLVTAENVGESHITGVTFALKRGLPEGWSAHLAGDVDLANESQPLPTGNAIEAPVAVRVDANARANEAGSVLVEARSNDAGASLPLSIQAAHERDVAASAPDEVEVAPGENASLEVRLENRGNGEEELELISVSHPGAWNVTTRDPDPIAAFGGTANATVNIQVPEDAPAGPAPIRLQAIGAGGLRVYANLTATVQPIGALAWGNVSDQLARAGGSLEQPLALTNHGNVPANVSVTAGVDGAWGLDARPGTLEIPPGATRTVTIAGPVPASAEGDHQIDVTAASKQGAIASTRVPVEVVQPTLELAELNVPDPPRREGDVVFVSALLHNPSPAPVVDAQVRLEADNGTLDTASFASIGPNGTVVAPLKWTHEAGASSPRVAWGTVHEDAFVESGSQPLPVEASQDEEGEDRLVPWPGMVPVATVVAAVGGMVARRRRTHSG